MLKEVARYALVCFLITMTGIVIFVFVHMQLFAVDLVIRQTQFGQFILFSFFCALSMFIFYSRRDISDREMLLRQAIHFSLITAGTMFLCLLWRWILPQTRYVVFMLAVIVIVYSIILSVVLIENQHAANQLNRAIQRRKNKRGR